MRYPFIVILLIFCSCGTSRGPQSEFIGHHKSLLNGKMGSPDVVESDGKGGEVWIYQHKETRFIPEQEIMHVQRRDKAGRIDVQKTERHPAREEVYQKNHFFLIDADGNVYQELKGSRPVKK